MFGLYADYYDLIYSAKDYQSETEKVLALLADQNISQGTLLELGCGTGRHAISFARNGFNLVGMDISEDMLDQARQRIADYPDLADRITLSKGDARSFRLGRKVDAVVSLFHVMSYQTTKADLREVATRAAEHLDSGGIFLFDFWYGPAVVADPPVLRVKRAEDDKLAITRIAEPRMNREQDTVEVQYEIFAKRPGENAWSNFLETHTVRYLFDDEIHSCLTDCGFEILGIQDWATDEPAGSGSWNAYCIARLK